MAESLTVAYFGFFYNPDDSQTGMFRKLYRKDPPLIGFEYVNADGEWEKDQDLARYLIMGESGAEPIDEATGAAWYAGFFGREMPPPED